MRRASVLLVAFALTAGAGSAHAAAPRGVTTTPVSFNVTNPLSPGTTLRVAGTLYEPADEPKCDSSVMLLVHGLSYGRWAWDFPIDPARYSVARALVAGGRPAVAIDLPGYGESDHPNGQTLTVASYGAMVQQVGDQLRSGSYGGPAFAKVGLVGHSAGTEISELAAGTGAFDALVATGYTHVPSPRIVQDFFTGDYLRAAQSDYEYFGKDPKGRLEYMYNAPAADPAVMARDNQMANLTPSGEIYSIGPQPSKGVMAFIRSPVLVVLAQRDVLFPVDYAQEEMALFAGTADKALHVVPDSGHAFMLHRSAPETNAVIGKWLDAHASAVPPCAVKAQSVSTPAAAGPPPAGAGRASPSRETHVQGASQTRTLPSTGGPSWPFPAGLALVVIALATRGTWRTSRGRLDTPGGLPSGCSSGLCR